MTGADEAPSGGGPGAGLRCAGLTCGWPGHPPVLTGLDAPFAPGLHVIVGPNGAGKSTWLRTLAGRLPPQAGAVTLADRPLATWAPKALARRLAWLPQHPTAPEGLTPRGLAAQGRLPHRGWLWGGDAQADAAAVTAALQATGALAWADRPLDRLSGGEQRRAWIALTLAQGADVLLLDEPTAALDPAAALAMVDLLQALAGAGRTVIAVLHDLNLAARCADQLWAVGGGGLVAAGPPSAVLTPPLLRRLYRIEARIISGAGGRPHVVAEGPAAG